MVIEGGSADPTCSGYTFQGWYTDAAGTAANDWSAPVTEDLTRYAKWTEISKPAPPGSGGLSLGRRHRDGLHRRLFRLKWQDHPGTAGGVMSGKGGGVLDPKGFATRAQTAKMLKNFLENS